MAATPSHSSWSKRVISLLPESTAASLGRGALLGKPISESQKAGCWGGGARGNHQTSVPHSRARTCCLLGTENMTHPRPPHQSQNRWGGAQESS